MSNANNGASGTDSSAGGTTEEKFTKPNTSDADAADSSSDDLNGSDSYPAAFVKKLMTEKKNKDAKLKEALARLDEIELKEKERTEQKLKDEKKWQEYAQLKEKERNDAMAKLSDYEKQAAEADKFNALLSAIPGQVKRQYWGLLGNHLADIVINPETNEPDPVSVKQVADKVRELYADIISDKGGPKLPSDAAQASRNFDATKWDSMSAKEKKENLHLFVASKSK